MFCLGGLFGSVENALYWADGVGVNANDIVEYNTVTGGSASVDSSLLFFKGDPTVRYNNFVIGSQDRLLYADTYVHQVLWQEFLILEITG